MLLDLIGGQHWFESDAVWIFPHLGLSAVAAFAASQMLLKLLDQNTDHTEVVAGNTETAVQGESTQTETKPVPVTTGMPTGSGLFCLCFCSSLLMPLVGTIGLFSAFYYGFREAQLRHRDPDYWQVTQKAVLPFTTPKGREATQIDNRGFIEHLMYSSDDNDLYRKVLAAGNIQTSLSIAALKRALQHSDERIRLTAYKTLDKKVTVLNLEIQQLESQMSEGDGKERSNSWLQIASNYWELLTLESGEPVARKQLLEKAAAASIQAVSVLPINRNAHFILGRVSLMQGDIRRARIAFERSRALGMPADKVLPYLAETAFKNHEFKRVRSLLAELDASVRVYPPLSHVTEYWA